MIEDAFGRMLHDKATRGTALSHAEQAHLDQWYVAQDAAEVTVLRLTTSPVLVALQTHLTAARARSIERAQGSRDLTEQNDALGHEIDLLRQKLVHRFPIHPA